MKPWRGHTMAAFGVLLLGTGPLEESNVLLIMVSINMTATNKIRDKTKHDLEVQVQWSELPSCSVGYA